MIDGLRTTIAAAVAAAMLCAHPTLAQTQAPQAPLTMALDSRSAGSVISRDIFGQFAEMLGEGIYGGVWVGRDSKIPNVRGIRTDVVNALRDLNVPNVRWPGGCYADQYHWRNGVGQKRVPRVNATWGGVIDPNSFGTHEFMDFVEQIGSEAYISINIGSGTVEEAADWLEYMTSSQPTVLAQERAKNGRPQPWKVKFLGLGNESWGCGGMFKADEYAQKMRQYGSMVKSLHPEQMSSFFTSNPNAMQRIGVGEGLDETKFTEAVMQSWQMGQPFFTSVDGLSLHHYTGSMMFDASANFGEREYAQLLKSTYQMDRMIVQHSTIMDKYDPGKKVSLVIDEWGAWLKPLPGKNMMFLRQQNSIRDAILAAINLNIFARHSDRVRMANIAQMVNVIQAMILTDEERMLLTPTYFVFKMYKPFQDATLVPLKLDQGQYKFADIVLPQVDGIAARGRDGKVWIALANLDANRTTEVRLEGFSAVAATGETLTADRVDAINTFDDPGRVAPKPYSARAVRGVLTLRLPARSVTVVQLDGAVLPEFSRAQAPVVFSTTTTPISVLFANPATRAIIDRHLPGFSAGAAGITRETTLRQMKILVPDMLRDEVLDRIDAAFKALPGQR